VRPKSISNEKQPQTKS